MERNGAVLSVAAFLALTSVGIVPASTTLHLPATVAFYRLVAYGILAGEASTDTTAEGVVGMWTGER